MGFMDNMKSKMGDIGEMRTRFEELKSKESAGELDDKGREELQQLRSHFENDNQ